MLIRVKAETYSYRWLDKRSIKENDMLDLVSETSDHKDDGIIHINNLDQSSDSIKDIENKEDQSHSRTRRSADGSCSPLDLATMLISVVSKEDSHRRMTY